MKYHFIYTILFGTLTWFLSACSISKTASDSMHKKSIVILHDNDVHCNIDGYASIASLRDAISDTAYVATVSSRWYCWCYFWRTICHRCDAFCRL